MAVQKRKVNVACRRQKLPLVLLRDIRTCINPKHKRLVRGSLYICSICCKSRGK